MPIYRTVSLLVLGGTLSLALGACGEDRLSESEFKQKAEAICREASKNIEGQPSPTSEDQVADYLMKSRLEIEKGIERLRDLNPPKDVQNDFNSFLEIGDELTAKTKEAEESAKDGDQDALRKFGEDAEDLDGKSDTLARKAGIPGCAES